MPEHEPALVTTAPALGATAANTPVSITAEIAAPKNLLDFLNLILQLDS